MNRRNIISNFGLGVTAFFSNIFTKTIQASPITNQNQFLMSFYVGELCDTNYISCHYTDKHLWRTLDFPLDFFPPRTNESVENYLNRISFSKLIAMPRLLCEIFEMDIFSKFNINYLNVRIYNPDTLDIVKPTHEFVIPRHTIIDKNYKAISKIFDKANLLSSRIVIST